MTFLRAHFAKFVVGAVTILALSSMYPDTASAGRYAMAYDGFGELCTGAPGNYCD